MNNLAKMLIDKGYADNEEMAYEIIKEGQECLDDNGDLDEFLSNYNLELDDVVDFIH
jgi:hypothetical protein